MIEESHRGADRSPTSCARNGEKSPASPTSDYSPDAYPSGGNPSLSHRWAKWHSRLMAPIESRTPDWRMGFGLQTARTGLRYRNPVIERTAISRVSKSFRGIFNLGSTSQGKGLVAADLVHLDVDVIVGFGTLPPLAAMQATTTIPIVMAAAGDPVGSGLVVSLARPGGNVMADVRGTKGPRRSLPGAFSCRRPGLFRPHHCCRVSVSH